VVVVACVLMLASVLTDQVDAQMFGARQVGRPLSRQAGPGAGAALENQGVGTLRNQRFLRGNRSARNFVGTDRTDAEFIGAQQAGAGINVRSAVTSVNTGSGDGQVNQPLTRGGANSLYEPRLTIGFPYDGPPREPLLGRLSERLQRQVGPQVAVSLAGRTATLRGAVGSAEERELAELLTSFEPGISDVQNDLRVVDGMTEAMTPTPPAPPISPAN
jgi:hypothetical protein